eukprot:jgi/Hompol1/4108/HPOL_003471-RA
MMMLLAAALALPLLAAMPQPATPHAIKYAPEAAGAKPQVRRFYWTVTNTTAALDGVRRHVLGVNGLPGHQTALNVNEGDIVEVTVRNSLAVPTALHWHGIRQQGTNEADGAAGNTQCPIAPGRSYTYRFVASPPGTTWWHAHFGTQYVDDLRGPLIVHPKVNAYKHAYDEEKTIQISDWFHQNSDDLLAFFVDPNQPRMFPAVPKSLLINGRGQYNCSGTTLPCNKNAPRPTINFDRGTRYRLRFINTAAEATMWVSIDNHTMTVIEVDGTEVKPVEVTRIFLSPAQRYSVIVKANQPSCIYKLRLVMPRAEPYREDLRPDPYANYKVTADIIYNGAYDDFKKPSPPEPTTFTDLSYSQLKTVAPQTIPPEDFNITLSFGFNNAPIKGDPRYSYIIFDLFSNDPGTAWRPSTVPTLASLAIRNASISSLPTNAVPLPVPYGAVVQLLLVNLQPVVHPFHLHGHGFWVIDRGLATSFNLPPFVVKDNVIRDTIDIPGCTIDPNGGAFCIDSGYAVIRFITDNPGSWLFHCHNDWHMGSGMAATVIVGTNDQISGAVTAQSRKNLVDNCKNFGVTI